MQSFSRGWSFLQQAWGMAFKDKDLIKPSIYALIVGSIVSIIGAIPIIITAVLFGDSGRIGQFLLAVMGAILVFVNFLRHDGVSDLRIPHHWQWTDEQGLVDRAPRFL